MLSKIFLILFLTLAVPALAIGEEIIVGDIATRKMSEVDSSGDVWFSVRALVKNTYKTNKNVSLTIQAVDRDGFELTSVTLTGRIRAGVQDILTDKNYMSDKNYRQISKWQVKRIRESDL